MDKRIIWQAYGKQYISTFEFLLNSNNPDSKAQAAQVGCLALKYLIRAKEFEKLEKFTPELINGTRNTYILHSIINELTTILDTLQKNKNYWRVLIYLADAWRNAGEPEKSLPFYKKALMETETLQYWSYVGVLCHNWATALIEVGQITQAKKTYLNSIAAKKRANCPLVEIISSELEILRIKIKQNQADKVISRIERRLVRLRTWNNLYKKGRKTDQAPDIQFLNRTLSVALGIAYLAHWALENWKSCLAVIREREKIEKLNGANMHTLAITRYNQYIPLINLGRLDKAQRTLEKCLIVFNRFDDIIGKIRTLTALADLWYKNNDVKQSIALLNKVLIMTEKYNMPEDRATAHRGLGIYLYEKGNINESAKHLLAALTYNLVTNNQQDIASDLDKFYAFINNSIQNNTENEDYIPYLIELLNDINFYALRDFIKQSKFDVLDIQAEINQLLEQIVNKVLVEES